MLYSDVYSSPFGSLFLESDGTSLIGLKNDYWKKNSASLHTNYTSGSHLSCIDLTKKWLDIYFSGHAPDFIPPLLLSGTNFQKMVWQLLLQIPFGKLATYGDIAHQIIKLKNLKSMSAQAVGGAVGANPIAIIIPCHRVIGKNNNLVGYRGGLNLKYNLLKLEKIPVESLIMPKISPFL